VIDLDALEHNIQAMAAHASTHGYALRPVAKIHKSSAIARLQMAAGAIGQSCATLAEAEVMVDAGIRGVLLFSSVVSHAKLVRLGALNARADGLLVEVHPDPTCAQSDGEQSLTFDAFMQMMQQARVVAGAMGRTIAAPTRTVAPADVTW
jgi:D-serine deaminase-like pyridoxal phosphate-dependent protein